MKPLLCVATKFKTELDDVPFNTSGDKCIAETQSCSKETNDRNPAPNPLTSKPTTKPKYQRKRPSTSTPETLERIFTNLLLAKKRLSCEICDYSTTRRYQMLQHMLRCHMKDSLEEAQKKPFCCEICGTRMSELCNLKKHMLLHTGVKPFPCLVEGCDRRFVQSSERKIHMRGHVGEKPYECDKCSARFASANQMTKHKVIRHSDYRKYHCETCGKTFNQSNTFKHHLLTHTDIKPYSCDICGRCFARRIAFQVHMNIHTDNRPYKCSLCDRGFHSSAARRSHEKSVHKKA